MCSLQVWDLFKAAVNIKFVDRVVRMNKDKFSLPIESIVIAVKGYDVWIAIY
jgi:hypothetical protein